MSEILGAIIIIFGIMIIYLISEVSDQRKYRKKMMVERRNQELELIRQNELIEAALFGRQFERLQRDYQAKQTLDGWKPLIF